MLLSRGYCTAARLLSKLYRTSLHNEKAQTRTKQPLSAYAMRIARSSKHLSNGPGSDNTPAGHAGTEAAIVAAAAATGATADAAGTRTVGTLAAVQHLTQTALVAAVDTNDLASSTAAPAVPASAVDTDKQQTGRSRKTASSKRAASHLAPNEPHEQHHQQQQQQVLRSCKRHTAASGIHTSAGAVNAAPDSAAVETADSHNTAAPAAVSLAGNRRQRRVKSAAAQEGTAAAGETGITDPRLASTTAAATTSASMSTVGVMAAGSSKAAAAAAAAGAAAAGAAAAASGPVLLDLGELVVGEVLKRPSATVRTPYVADVRLSCGTEVLAHTPALDCAGLMLRGSRVHMTANLPKGDRQKATKTSHAVQLVEDEHEDGSTTTVGAHPYLAEKLAEAAVAQHLLPLPTELLSYTSVLKQQTVGTGRFDFVLCYEDGSRLLLEVKNAVCADYPAGKVPAWRSKVCLYTSDAEQYGRTALFPVGKASKASGVVSDRAIKHLHELTKLQLERQDEQGRAVRCAVMFIVNRSDCAAFRPCHEADMMFARMLQRAQQAGVLVMAHDVTWRGGMALWGKQLPVVYGEAVQAADIDEQQLQAVLELNATNPRTHWKKGRADAAHM